MNQKLAAIILAAGKGKRMKSDLPKVLHKINGIPMISLLLDNLAGVDFERIIVVVGHKGEMVIDELKNTPIEFVWQKEQLGTGHAVLMAEESLKEFDGTVLVAAGDAPFLKTKTVDNLFAVHNQNKASATCLSAVFDDPSGYGRIVRKGTSDILLDIVEHKDADETIRRINEINSGTFCFNCRDMFDALHEIGNDNTQKEYYLTDTIKILQGWGKTCAVLKASDPIEAIGVNSVDQLENAEKSIKENNI
jgi:UDP-N-acetylglucosamine diphosphorylase/glucosamine-1-phosphate N-acetyltransferase